MGTSTGTAQAEQLRARTQPHPPADEAAVKTL